MAQNSKGIGSGFERDFAKFLTEWLTGQKKEYYFWRAPGSGSVSTVTMMNPDISGDIIAVKPEAQFFTKFFSIELKKGYPKASFDLVLKNNKEDEIRDFWEQAVVDSKKGKKNPLLIFKKKGYKDPWLGITDELYTFLCNDLKGCKFVHIDYGSKNLPSVYFLEMSKFFKILDVSTLKKRMEEWELK